MMVSILRFSLIIGLAESQVLYPRHGQQVSPDETLSRKVGEMLREHVMPILKTYFEDMQKDQRGIVSLAKIQQVEHKPKVFPPLKYSPPCQDCSCIPENTLSCNSYSGQCICKAGYEGDNCSCRKGNHACNLQFATCQIWFNREMCICKPQYANLGISGCQDVVRLRDGNSTYNGRVEVYRNEEWMTVCDDGWNKHDAMVTCRMLGLPLIYPQAVPGGVFPSGHVSQGIGMDDVYCDGDESFLTDCKHSATENCGHSEDAGVICDPECPSLTYGFTCQPCICDENNTRSCNSTTGECTCRKGFFGDDCGCEFGKHHCNLSSSYCGYSSGSPVCYCKTGSHSSSGCRSIKLVKDTDSGRKRLELFVNGSWGTICKHMFDKADATVACRQLGLPTFYAEPVFGVRPGKGFILYENIMCIGHEQSLLNCTKDISQNCSHSDDVGVRCLSSCPKWKYGAGCSFTCICNRGRSESCNARTGECACKSGWFGPTCGCSSSSVCDRNFTRCNGRDCLCMEGTYTRAVNCSGKHGVTTFYSFERDDNTSFTQMTNDDFDWTRRSGSTPSSNTGPRSAVDGQYYLYIEGSSPQTEGERAVVSFPISQIGNVRCFHFKYNMRGSQIGTIQVHLYFNGETEMVFNRTGSQGNTWQEAIISLNQDVTEIWIEAVRGDGIKSDIAIDELYTVQDRC